MAIRLLVWYWDKDSNEDKYVRSRCGIWGEVFEYEQEQQSDALQNVTDLRSKTKINWLFNSDSSPDINNFIAIFATP